MAITNHTILLRTRYKDRKNNLHKKNKMVLLTFLRKYLSLSILAIIKKREEEKRERKLRPAHTKHCMIWQLTNLTCLVIWHYFYIYITAISLNTQYSWGFPGRSRKIWSLQWGRLFFRDLPRIKDCNTIRLLLQSWRIVFNQTTYYEH